MSVANSDGPQLHIHILVVADRSGKQTQSRVLLHRVNRWLLQHSARSKVNFLGIFGPPRTLLRAPCELVVDEGHWIAFPPYGTYVIANDGYYANEGW